MIDLVSKSIELRLEWPGFTSLHGTPLLTDLSRIICRDESSSARIAQRIGVPGDLLTGEATLAIIDTEGTPA